MIDMKLVHEANGLIQRLNEVMLYCSGKRRARINRIHARASARWVRRYTKTHL